MQGDLRTKMEELDDMDLTDTTEADGPQILLESWLATLRDESLSAILKFVRSLEEIRGDKKPSDLYSGFHSLRGEPPRSGGL